MACREIPAYAPRCTLPAVAVSNVDMFTAFDVLRYISQVRAISGDKLPTSPVS